MMIPTFPYPREVSRVGNRALIQFTEGGSLYLVREDGTKSIVWSPPPEPPKMEPEPLEHP